MFKSRSTLPYPPTAENCMNHYSEMEKAFNVIVEEWHNSNTKEELSEYMGMTFDEYADFMSFLAVGWRPLAQE